MRFLLHPFRILRISLLSALWPTCGFYAAYAQEGTAIEPTQRINWIDSKYFRSHIGYLKEGTSLTDDPAEAWKLQDDGTLHVTGLGWGYLRSQSSFRDYHLVMEYKWGERTWAHRSDGVRDGGLLIHGNGPEGAIGGSWIRSFQAQLIEGGSGDFVALGAKGEEFENPQFRANALVNASGKALWNKEKGVAMLFPPEGKTIAMLGWKDRDEDWSDKKGYRGSQDIENPPGEWNRLEVISRNDTVTLKLNGIVVNQATDVNPSQGFISLQSEFSEYYIKKLDIYPLGEFTENWAEENRSANMGYSVTGESIMPRRLPLSPLESKAMWKIDGDFDIELVAAEPLTCDPVDLVWDSQGRMYVAEMRDYPLPPQGRPFLSRIRMLEDLDEDGMMDKATTWADDLDHVQGLLPYQDGLIATTRTDILFLKDSDGDNIADLRESLFKSNDPRHNQLQISSPRWGIDNHIYLNNGLDGKEIYPTANPEEKVNFARLNLRFDPFSNKIEPVSGSGQYGASLDNFNRRFFCSNRNPIMFAVMPLHSVKRNPIAGISVGHEDIQEPGAPVWPLALSHTTSQAHAGTHTAACGLAIYRGGLLSELEENIFVCDPTAQLVTRNRLLPNGASFTAERIGEKRDFLVSGDEWTRPVQVRNGPDGALYICDMYRRFIDHSRFFPEDFQKTHYMRAGFDHGRIWKLVPKGHTHSPTEPITKEPKSLLTELKSKVPWRRVQAQRILAEDSAILSESTSQLKELLHSANQPETRAQALWLLHHANKLEAKEVLHALQDRDERVVENAVNLVIRHFPNDDRFSMHLQKLASHMSPRLRFLSLLSAEHSTFQLSQLLAQDYTDQWLRKAVLASHGPQAGSILVSLLNKEKFLSKTAPEKVTTLLELASAAAANSDLAELSKAITSLSQMKPSVWYHYAILNGISAGLRKGKLPQKNLASLIQTPPEGWQKHTQLISEMIEQSTSLILDTKRSNSDRISALPLLAQQGFEKMKPVVKELLLENESSEMQEHACRSLSRFNREEVADFFFGIWSELSPTGIREALSLIVGNPKSGLLLMRKMQSGEIPSALMPPMTRWSYGRSSNPEIKELANTLFGKTAGNRSEIVQKYQKALSELNGDPNRGAEIFNQAACATCHRINELGSDVGPLLSDVRIKPAAALLSDILDPNRAVEERWVSATITTHDGRSLMGLVGAENEVMVEIKIPGGVKEQVPRSEIKTYKATGLSLMPEGLEAAIDEQAMADLIAFLKKG